MLVTLSRSLAFAEALYVLLKYLALGLELVHLLLHHPFGLFALAAVGRSLRVLGDVTRVHFSSEWRRLDLGHGDKVLV